MLISSFCLFNAKKNKLKSSLQLFLPPAFNNCLKKLVFSQLSRSTNKFKSNRSHRRLYLVIRHENEIKLNNSRLFCEIYSPTKMIILVQYFCEKIFETRSWRSLVRTRLSHWTSSTHSWGWYYTTCNRDVCVWVKIIWMRLSSRHIIQIHSVS